MFDNDNNNHHYLLTVTCALRWYNVVLSKSCLITSILFLTICQMWFIYFSLCQPTIPMFIFFGIGLTTLFSFKLLIVSNRFQVPTRDRYVSHWWQIGYCCQTFLFCLTGWQLIWSVVVDDCCSDGSEIECKWRSFDTRKVGGWDLCTLRKIVEWVHTVLAQCLWWIDLYQCLIVERRVEIKNTKIKASVTNKKRGV